MNGPKKLNTHHFVFNPKDHSDEQINIQTDFYHNGDPNGIFTNQCITMQSCCNHASMHLYGCQITPQILRHLADELEQAYEIANQMLGAQ